MSDHDTYREIITQWEQVEKDRAYARECLERTGPGESPWSLGMETAWKAREEALNKTVLASLPEVMAAISEKTKAPAIRNALQGLLAHYIALIKSGDCGNWNPHTEQQVIDAEEALK